MSGHLFGMVTVGSSSEYTQVALQSFFRHTRLQQDDSFVLIDNDGYWSNNCNNEWQDRIQVRVNPDPLNTSQNINQLISLADTQDKHLVFLSNDVVFSPRWYERLIFDDSILSVPSCNQTHNYGFAATLSLEQFDNRFSHLNVAAHQHAAMVRHPFEMLMMPTYVCRVPKKLYRAVGLFDEAFNVGGEDVDYRLRLLQQGFSIKYCSSYLLHFNGRSSWNGVETDAQTQERNSLYMQNFIHKWGEDLFNLCVTTGKPLEIVEKYQLSHLAAKAQFNQMILEVLKHRDTFATNI